MFDEDYGKTSQYLATTRNKLHNLKSHYKVDLVTANTGGNKLLSHIVFSKLSPELRKALIAETNSNYPTFDQIMEHANKVINTIVRTRKKKPISKPSSEKRGGGLPVPVVGQPSISLRELVLMILFFTVDSASLMDIVRCIVLNILRIRIV